MKPKWWQIVWFVVALVWAGVLCAMVIGGHVVGVSELPLFFLGTFTLPAACFYALLAGCARLGTWLEGRFHPKRTASA